MVLPILENTIGIDLGTTNCCIGVLRDGKVEIIATGSSGERTTPSYVYLNGSESVVGSAAANNVTVHEREVIYDAKRMIGRSFHDENIQKNLNYWRFKVEEGPQSKPAIKVPSSNGISNYFPEEISTIIIRHLKMIAEKYLGKPVKNAVVTVPAYFNYPQRTATQRAAEEAGFKVLQIINEPTAAALAFVDVNYKNQNFNKNIVIYDLGGGTFDISILKIRNDENGKSFNVLATSGDTYLGGRDFDNNLTDLILKKIPNARISDKLKKRVGALAPKTKIELSDTAVASVVLPFLNKDDDEDFIVTITRAEFDSINAHLFQRTMDILENSLKDAGLNKKHVDEVVLVGGSSKIPKIQEMLKSFFGTVPVSEAVNSSEAVAHGAAIKAATFDDDSVKQLVIADVTPLSLGVEAMGQKMSVLIKRNSSIPTEVRTIFCTAVDNQPSMKFIIYEGERSLVTDNTKLGSFAVDLPPKALGRPVELLFNLNENGILDVGVQVDSRIYRNLKINYVSMDPARAINAFAQAGLSKPLDDIALKRVNRLVEFEMYLRKIRALCDRDSKLSPEEKNNLSRIADRDLTWIEEVERSGLNEETNAQVVQKCGDVERIAEPIFKGYRYNVKNSMTNDFFKVLDSL